MSNVDLDNFLNRPPCQACNIGRVRAIDIHDGKHLTLQCPIPECGWTGRARLPEIRKKTIYLDTSTVSHMARAISRDEDKSPWVALYQSLRRAAALQVVCCPSSPIIKSEAELSPYSAKIIQLSKDFGDPGLENPLQIRHKQLFRALDRFLVGEEPCLETKLDPTEAFYKNVHCWLPVYDVSVDITTPPGWIEWRRRKKAYIRGEVERIYRQYADTQDPFEAIRASEAQGFGWGILEDGRQCLKRRLGLEPISNEEEFIGSWIPNTFDILIRVLCERQGLLYLEAAAKVEEFLLSEHVCLIPMADITSKLHAGIAMLCRGQKPRLPQASDPDDIEHIASFAPYIDIMITDRFFAELCNQGHLRIGDLYHCQILSLGQKEVPAFIQEIEKLVDDAPQAALAERILNAIEEGGFHQEFAERVAAYLRERGVDPENPMVTVG
jgi:hypothetical protein